LFPLRLAIFVLLNFSTSFFSCKLQSGLKKTEETNQMKVRFFVCFFLFALAFAASSLSAQTAQTTCPQPCPNPCSQPCPNPSPTPILSSTQWEISPYGGYLW